MKAPAPSPIFYGGSPRQGDGGGPKGLMIAGKFALLPQCAPIASATLRHFPHKWKKNILYNPTHSVEGRGGGSPVKYLTGSPTARG